MPAVGSFNVGDHYSRNWPRMITYPTTDLPRIDQPKKDVLALCCDIFLGIALGALPLTFAPGHLASPWTEPKFYVMVGALAGAGTAALAWGNSSLIGRIRAHRWAVAAAALFAVGSAGATFASQNRALSLGHGDDALVALAFRSVVLLVAVVSGGPRRRLLRVVVAAHCLIAGFAVLQYVGLDPWPVYEHTQVATRRTLATIGNPNQVATSLVVVFVSVVTDEASRLKTGRPRIAALAACVVLGAGVLATDSRAALLAVACSLVVVGCVGLRGHHGLSRRVAAVIASGLAVTVIGVVLSSRTRDELRSLFESGSVSDIGSSRLLIWQRSLQLVQEHWGFGTGPGTFSEAYSRFGPDPAGPALAAHNEVLQLLVICGVLPAACYIALAVAAIRIAVQGHCAQAAYLPLLAVVVCYVVKTMFNAAAISDAPLMWAAMGWIFAMHQRGDQPASTRSSEP